MKIDITKILNFEGNFLPLEYSNIKKGMYLKISSPRNPTNFRWWDE